MERDGRKKMRPSLFSEADLVPPVNMTFVTGKKHDLLYDWGKNFALVLTRLSGQLLHSSILTLVCLPCAATNYWEMDEPTKENQ